ncbi:MAG: hypothetical protein EBY13_02450 [Actinobacteria bacterium]|nr:hypothetical protein [Actinomycetota bacterium]
MDLYLLISGIGQIGLYFPSLLYKKFQKHLFDMFLLEIQLQQLLHFLLLCSYHNLEFADQQQILMAL